MSVPSETDCLCFWSPADGDREETEDSAELRRTESDSVLKKVQTGSSQGTDRNCVCVRKIVMEKNSWTKLAGQ